MTTGVSKKADDLLQRPKPAALANSGRLTFFAGSTGAVLAGRPWTGNWKLVLMADLGCGDAFLTNR
jgi:hypothetical protein